MDRTKLRETLAFLREMKQNPPPYHAAAWTRWLGRLIAQQEARLDPRGELTRRLPRILQPFLTWVTGKAGEEKPLWKNTEMSAYLVNLATLLGGTGAAATLLSALPGASLGARLILIAGAAVSTLAAAGAARAGSSTFLHHSTHGTYPAPAWWERGITVRQAKRGEASLTVKRDARESWNRLVGELISTLILAAPHELYQRDHRLHHSLALAIWDDPDWQFLFKYGGFRPGQDTRSYWIRLWKTLLSPRFHIRFLRSRLYDNFLNPETPRYRRLMAWGLYGTLANLFLFAVANGLIPFLLFAAVWTFAIVPLNQAGSLLQLLSEHRWQREPDSDSKKVVLARKTRGRFVSPPLPDAGLPQPLRALAWYNWGLRLLLIHLPIERLFLWPADLGSHDFHHRHIGGDWANSPYARRADIDTGTPGWEEPYQEDVWGIREALQEVFELLSSLPPTDSGNNLTNEDEGEMFRSM